MHKGENEKRTTPLELQWPISLLRGGIASLIISIGLLSVFAALVLIQVLPEGLERQVTVLCCAAGAFGGGVIGGTGEKKRILFGLCIGALLFLFLTFIGVLAYDVADIGKDGALSGLACLCGGTLSSLMGASGKRKGEGRGRRKKR